MSAHAVLTARSKDECIVDQGWSRYSSEDHETWRILFERQQRRSRGMSARSISTGWTRSASGRRACRISRR